MKAKTKKIIKITSIIAIVIVTAVHLALWLGLSGKDLEIEAALKTGSAKTRAREYFGNKYGEEFKIGCTEPLIVQGSFFARSLEGIIVYPREGDWSIIVRDDYIADSRQYDEITGDFKEKYFGDVRLADNVGLTETEETNIFMDFHHDPAPGNDFNKFTEVYYDGNIEKFLEEVKPDIDFYVSFEGDPEKPYDPEDYKELIEEKLHLAGLPSDCRTKGVFTVYDPMPCEPQMPYRLRNEVHGSLLSEGEIVLHEISFPKEDGLTYAVDLKTGKVFEPREMNLWKDTLNDDSIREKGYSMAVRGEDGVYLRLDREYYNITDHAVPLLVSEKTEQGRRSYRLDGSSMAYSKSCYYMNDKYIYIYIEELWGYGKYLAFADLDGEEFEEFFPWIQTSESDITA